MMIIKKLDYSGLNIMTIWEGFAVQISECPSVIQHAYISQVVKTISSILPKPVMPVWEVFFYQFVHFSESLTLYNNLDTMYTTCRNLSGATLCLKNVKTCFTLLVLSWPRKVFVAASEMHLFVTMSCSSKHIIRRNV